jgi:outer membrane lipoprotein LolB
MKWVFRRCAVLAMAFFGACAGIAPQSDQFPVPPFELNGRILVNDQEHRFTGLVRWECASAADDIWISAPLGRTVAHLHADANGAALTTADQTTYRASSVEGLTQSALGWRFPVAAMRHWVLGQPSPALPLADVERDGDQRLLTFAQGQWRVTLAYPEDGGLQPSRLDVAGGGAAIRLVIDSMAVKAP